MPFFSVNAVSVLWTWGRLDTLKEVNILVWVICIVYVFHHIENKESALKAIVVSSAVLAICAIIQAKILFPKLIEAFKGERYGDMVMSQAIPFASFLYHNVFGGYMSFVLPLALYFGIYLKKSLFQIATIFIMTGLILSTSRIAMVISGVFLLSFLFTMLRKKEFKKLLILLLTVAISILFIVILLKTGEKGELKGLSYELTKKARITKEEVKTINTRTEIWRNAINAFMAKPILGFGAGASEFAYRKYFDGGIYTRYTHSLILKIGVETGIIGILCFLFYISGFFYYSRKRLKIPLCLFIFASVCCGFLFGLFDFSFDMPAHNVTFFILSSMAFKNENKRSNVKNREKFIWIFIIVVLLASFMFTTKVSLAKKSIENAQALQENGFFINAIQSYNEAINELPWDNEGYIGLMSLLKIQYNMESDPQKKEHLKNLIFNILKSLEKKNDRDSQLYFAMGLCYETTGYDDWAEYYLLKASTLYPSSAQYLSEIVRFYLVRNRIEDADIWAKKIEPYLVRYRTSKNPVGFFVFKIKDMHAEIELRKGNKINALSILKDNLHDILTDKYLIYNIKTGLNIPRWQLIEYLKVRTERIKKGN
ncbi:MAG: O-antigen ligase family protein [Syntrophorhabdaceae bacterium]|nr:O-antigen ligase family protein [Syntrophorhabdaceae bacterium]